MRLFILFILPTVLFANDFIGAFVKKRGSKEVFRLECIERFENKCSQAQFVVVKEGEVKVINSNLLIRLGQSEDERYERAAIYNIILEQAGINRIPMPYAWFMFNMASVTKKLRSVILKIDTEKEDDILFGQTLSSKNFEALIEVVERFE